MSENQRAAIDIAQVVVPILLAMFSGLWFLVKRLIFTPLNDLGIEVRALRVDLVNIEHGFSERFITTDTELAIVKQRVTQLENRD